MSAPFERVGRRAAQRAEDRARARADRLAAALQAQLPRGLRAEAEPGGVTITGRAARRRLVLEAPLRWLIMEAGR